MKKCALSLALAAGIASTTAASNSPTTLGPTNAVVKQAGHIYYNLATGERVITMLASGQTAPAGTDTCVPIWSSNGGNSCVDQGFTTSFFFGLDDPGTTSLSTEATLVDWGDIEKDTVVDCLQINWVTAHPDGDTATGGTGVEGLAGQWIIYDADNGRPIDVSTRQPLIDFTFTSLPGNVFGAGSFTGWTADIDLTSTFTQDISFEIGDSDSDLQGAAFHNADIANQDNNFDGLPDSDLDGDGLFDWSWSVRFYQPGSTDFDGDGSPDGVPPTTDADTIGVGFGIPAGTAIDNGDGTWSWDIDTTTPDAGTGAEDVFALYDRNLEHAGNFWFGGFSCTADANGQYTPFAQFSFQLLGPAGPVLCPADLNGDGNVNFFDVSIFLQQYAQGGDYNGDGVTNFFDVSKFLQDYAAGCP